VRRRRFLGLMGLPFMSHAFSADVKPNPQLSFPRDHGAHPDYRTEWWYVTGWLNGSIGVQVTFFRVLRDVDPANPSAFNPRQILLAHAAIADPKRGRLLHEERAARTGFSLADAEETRTGVWIDDWRIEQHGHRYEVRIAGRELDMDLTLFATDLVLQGEGGYSRKGHRPEEASYYYSRPQLNMHGKVNGASVEGTGWLDHEWSSAYLAPEAAGWDWAGVNYLDGRSTMAFQMRGRAGGVHYAPAGVSFTPVRLWRSPRTGIEYPVEMDLWANNRQLRLRPLMDDQEFDARASTGIIYWEGAVRAFERNNEIGRGYLELTGYGKPMKL
jgi:predicted secreted hydrolase